MHAVQSAECHCAMLGKLGTSREQSGSYLRRTTQRPPHRRHHTAQPTETAVNVSEKPRCQAGLKWGVWETAGGPGDTANRKHQKWERLQGERQKRKRMHPRAELCSTRIMAGRQRG